MYIYNINKNYYYYIDHTQMSEVALSGGEFSPTWSIVRSLQPGLNGIPENMMGGRAIPPLAPTQVVGGGRTLPPCVAPSSLRNEGLLPVIVGWGRLTISSPGVFVRPPGGRGGPEGRLKKGAGRTWSVGGGVAPPGLLASP